VFPSFPPLGIDTEGYKRLLHILEVVENDTWQLFLDMHAYNAHAKPTRRAFMAAMENIHGQLEEAENTMERSNKILDNPKK